MSNFQVFNNRYLEKLIEPFLPGATRHITPIMYRAYTPDVFLFLFRLGVNGEEKFFVTFQYDFIENEELIANIVEKFIGVKPVHKVPLAQSKSLGVASFVCEDNLVYKSVMLLVPRPEKLGYWTDYILLGYGDDVDEALRNFSEMDRNQARALMAEGGEDRVISIFKNDAGSTDFVYS